MKYTLLYMDLALQDLRSIKNYLSEFYPGTWPRFSEKLQADSLSLTSMPYMCEAYRYNSEYRCMLVDDYIVFYKVSETEKTVCIHRILHGSRDIQRYMRFIDNI